MDSLLLRCYRKLYQLDDTIFDSLNERFMIDLREVRLIIALETGNIKLKDVINPTEEYCLAATRYNDTRLDEIPEHRRTGDMYNDCTKIPR